MKRTIKINDKVIITNPESFYYDEWGTVIAINEDGEYYVAIADGMDSVPIFDISELKRYSIKSK